MINQRTLYTSHYIYWTTYLITIELYHIPAWPLISEVDIEQLVTVSVHDAQSKATGVSTTFNCNYLNHEWPGLQKLIAFSYLYSHRGSITDAVTPVRIFVAIHALITLGHMIRLPDRPNQSRCTRKGSHSIYITIKHTQVYALAILFF